MTSKQSSRLAFRWRLTLALAALLLVFLELVVHGLLAKKYYDLNVEILRLTAVAAVKIGAQHLPTDPSAAVREADAYAEHHGIARAEIVFTKLSSDHKVLTIRLVRKIPRYFAVLILGGLPTRDIEVTASARQEHNALVGHSIMFFDCQIAPRLRFLQCPSTSALRRQRFNLQNSWDFLFWPAIALPHAVAG